MPDQMFPKSWHCTEGPQKWSFITKKVIICSPKKLSLFPRIDHLTTFSLFKIICSLLLTQFWQCHDFGNIWSASPPLPLKLEKIKTQTWSQSSHRGGQRVDAASPCTVDVSKKNNQIYTNTSIQIQIQIHKYSQPYALHPEEYNDKTFKFRK